MHPRIAGRVARSARSAASASSVRSVVCSIPTLSNSPCQWHRCRHRGRCRTSAVGG
jgi:hypothetical protein